MRNFSSMWIYFADINPGQLVMFLLGGICRVCGGEKRLTDQTFHCEGETEKKSYKTKLNSSLTLKERKPWFKQEPSFSRLSRTKEKKFSMIYCHAHSLCSQYCNKIPSWDVLQLSSNVPRHIKKDWQEDKWGAKNWVNWVEILEKSYLSINFSTNTTTSCLIFFPWLPELVPLYIELYITVKKVFFFKKMLHHKKQKRATWMLYSIIHIYNLGTKRVEHFPLIWGQSPQIM